MAIETDSKSNWMLYLLIFLSVLFFAILFMSTAFKDISQNYTYLNEVRYSEGDIKLGEVTLTNNGFISARSDLKRLVGCIDGDESLSTYDRTVNIEYIGSKNEYYDQYSRSYVELFSGEEKKLGIYARYIPITKYEYDIENRTIKDFDIAIYEMIGNDDMYNYCLQRDEEQKVASVSVVVE